MCTLFLFFPCCRWRVQAKTEFRSDESTALATAGGATGGSGTGGGGGGGGAGGSGGPADTGKFSILDHDFVVWFGDFNYRIVETVSTERCFELACSGRCVAAAAVAAAAICW